MGTCGRLGCEDSLETGTRSWGLGVLTLGDTWYFIKKRPLPTRCAKKGPVGGAQNPQGKLGHLLPH